MFPNKYSRLKEVTVRDNLAYVANYFNGIHGNDQVSAGNKGLHCLVLTFLRNDFGNSISLYKHIYFVSFYPIENGENGIGFIEH